MNYSVCNEINQAHAYKIPTQRTLYLFLSKFHYALYYADCYKQLLKNMYLNFIKL